MLGHRALTIEDYTGILKRRGWLILGSAVLCFLLGLGLTYVIPQKYVSQTLILIEEQKVPEDYVKPVVNEDLGERLASMKEQILSRSRVQPIIERFNLFAGKGRNMDDRIELTQKAIGIKPIQSNRGMPGFFISFTAPDARTAQQVCGEITSLFVSENLSAREQTAEGTTDFLKQQLEDSKRSLDEQDAKLAAFERKYLGQLPEQESSNSNTLQSLTTQLDAANQNLSRAEQSETFIQAMISEQTQDLKHTEPVSNPALEERKAQLKTLQSKKKELDALYTPDYPDIVAINREISDLQGEIARTTADSAATISPTAPGKPDSPQLQELRAQLRGVQQTITSAKQEQVGLRQRIGAYEGKLAASPMVEEQYKEITRDHDSALKFYNDLLTKMNQSSMATALEHRQQGEQFHVMDAPNLPDAPTFPNPVIFSIGGLLAGILVGTGLAAYFEYRDTAIRNERDVFAFTKLPTLAAISYLEGLPQVPQEQRKGWWPFSRAYKPAESLNG
jgi:polysaccharide chain length determinant protein (PEP-CTERM system associated)